ncbi:MAG: alanine--tRNA ligase [Cyclobacteriaceae bacterium]|nr:alanine--tRNA ligase [Cyclobacteriaceae bacterium]
MNSEEIRQKFLDFFKSKEHRIVNSAPLVVKDDPTLMFTNAGMNQFKDIFLGTKDTEFSRVADTQKCLRVSGKHNDLEEVGIDTYHHTMFEMLGNWSFGDYFKKEAILWAWELLTGIFGLPEERIYATVFEGDTGDGLEKDDEAYQIWKNILPENRILYGSKKDNFWEMGETGPCGPCSEIHIDLRPEDEIRKVNGSKLVNQDHPRVIEVWNLVFIQFNRLANGKLENLPEKHVDTGMGFERLVMAIQGKTSNYDTDVFQPLICEIASRAHTEYGRDEKTDIAMRVISDHIRAVAFTIADGQLPSNNKAGYVIRRILRRAVRYGFTYLHFSDPTIYQLVDVLSGQFRNVFPEIHDQKEFIKRVIFEEESSFLKTLENGLKRFDQIKSQMKKGSNTIAGNTVFELYDTYGFPVDLTALIAKENGLSIDEEGFRSGMNKQKERSKQAARQEAGDWTILKEIDRVEFLGYERIMAKAFIARYRAVKIKERTQFQIVLDQTPFYAESGGQVGDRGYIQADGERVHILDTKKENELIIHITHKLPEDPLAEFTCVVDEHKRRLTENNHSATHLLHAALRKVLGNHVQQRGSLVNEELLRFDFSHYARMTPGEIREVEQLVNKKIRENIMIDEKRNIRIDEAKKLGAMALFGEKYGDFVRVISFDPAFSVELCGGTHVAATGTIGIFKIISKSSIAAGVRRIEAITADKAESYINDQLDLLQEINLALKNPKNPLRAVETLLTENNKLQKEIESLGAQKALALKDELISRMQRKDGINVITERIQVPDASVLKNLAFQIRQQVKDLYLVLATEIDGKPLITVMISENLVEQKNLHAGKIVKDLAREIDGGGGGQAFYATAGGKDPDGIDNVLKKSLSYI